MPIPFLAIGAYMLVGAGISALWNLASGKSVTAQTLVVGAVGGAVGFGVGGVVLARTSSVVLANVLGGAAGGGSSQVVDNAYEGRPLTDNVATSALVGGAVGGAVTPLVPVVTSASRQLARAVSGAADDVRPSVVAGAADDARPGVAAAADDARPVAGLADEVRPVNPASEAMPPYALGPPVRSVRADSLRFSQRTAGGDGGAEFHRANMRSGWRGEPVDVVETPGGWLTTIDNTRVAVARELGIDTVPVRVHAMDELLPASMLRRGPGDELGPRFGEAARTWGDALRYRTARQGRRFPQDGSTEVPRLQTAQPPAETIGLSGALRR